MPAPIPPRYRRLLATYPAAWRQEHGDVVLGTLLEADEAAGRDRPSTRERIALLVGGLLTRPPSAVRRHASPLPVAGAGFQLSFDQSNGLSPEREPTEAELVTWNSREDRSLDGERVAGAAMVGLWAMAR